MYPIACLLREIWSLGEFNCSEFYFIQGVSKECCAISLFEELTCLSTKCRCGSQLYLCEVVCVDVGIEVTHLGMRGEAPLQEEVNIHTSPNRVFQSASKCGKEDNRR
eukprot:762454-Amphidinium_carterae.2